MLVTILKINMSVRECWFPMLTFESVTHISNRPKGSQTRHQHKLSPTSVTNTFVTLSKSGFSAEYSPNDFSTFSQFYERAYFGHILQKSVDYYYRKHVKFFQLKSLSVRIMLNIRKLGIWDRPRCRKSFCCEKYYAIKYAVFLADISYAAYHGIFSQHNDWEGCELQIFTIIYKLWSAWIDHWDA